MFFDRQVVILLLKPYLVKYLHLSLHITKRIIVLDSKNYRVKDSWSQKVNEWLY